jgi:hypothetical protein
VTIHAAITEAIAIKRFPGVIVMGKNRAPEYHTSPERA